MKDELTTATPCITTWKTASIKRQSISALIQITLVLYASHAGVFTLITELERYLTVTQALVARVTDDA